MIYQRLVAPSLPFKGRIPRTAGHHQPHQTHLGYQPLQDSPQRIPGHATDVPRIAEGVDALARDQLNGSVEEVAVPGSPGRVGPVVPAPGWGLAQQW